MIRLAFLLVLLASPLSAQTVQVTGGEHDGFTRLVFRTSPDQEWSVDQAPEGVMITFPPTWVYDLDDAFTRIPRTRVRALTPQGEGAVLIDLACDCDAHPFLWNDIFLVVDIRPAEPELARVLPVVSEAPPTLPVTPWITQPDTAALSNIEAELANSLAQAAGLGVLIPVDGLEQLPAPALPLPHADPPIGLGTHNELALALLGQPRDVELSKQHCVPTADFAVEAWRETAESPAYYYANLSGEFDRIDTDIAFGLARTYLAHGLISEAKSVLPLLPETPEAKVIVELIAVLSGSTAQSDFLKEQQYCENGALVWAVANGVATLPIDFDRFEREFRLLPSSVRDDLFDAVATQLMNWGEAERVRALAGRISSDHPAIESALAMAAFEQGDPVDGYRLLIAEVRDGSLDLLQAAQVLSTAIQYDLSIPDDVFALIDTVGFLWRNDPIYRQVLLDQAEIHTREGRYEKALAILGELMPASPDANSRFAEMIAQNAPDAVFLRLALTGLPNDLHDTANLQVGERLARMGFANQATAFGTMPPATFTNPVQDPAFQTYQSRPDITLAETTDILKQTAESRDRITELLSLN